MLSTIDAMTPANSPTIAAAEKTGQPKVAVVAAAPAAPSTVAPHWKGYGIENQGETASLQVST